MNRMDDTHKSILLGVGVAFLVGIVTFLFSTDTAQKKTKKVMRKHKAKKYINKLPGNKSKTRKFLDKLSDEDLRDLVGAGDMVDDIGDKFSHMGSDLKDYVHDKSKDTKKFMKKMK
ncbi:hypothetical protein GCM10008932_10780 [Alkalibacterium iburiense]|uniref:YtxH domain-containing protein n=1 Tax=Alkalibacterium iburiense TaxID=290589 RepID=A0ABP3H5J9_9LACT